MGEKSGFTTAQEKQFKDVVLQHSQVSTIPKGTVLFKQGDQDFSFFYILEGTVELQFDGQTRRILNAGNFFGEIRMIGKLPRTATATCLSVCRIAQLSEEMLLDLISKNQEFKKIVFAKYGARLLHYRTRSDKHMMQLRDSAYEEILSYFEPVSLSEKQFLFSRNEASDSLYILLRGKLDIMYNGDVISSQGPGEFVGEIGLLYEIPRTASVFVPEPVELLQCKSENLRALLSKFRPLHVYLQNLATQRLSSGPAERLQFLFR